MNIFIIGPGGVGKSTSGKILADLIQYKFIDLDKEFCKEIGDITAYITENGYEKYCLENSKLFYRLLEKNSENCVFALSSGFLVHENMDELTANHRKTIQEKGLSILLLPSESKEESVDIVVKRQLSRGFGLDEEKEKLKFIKRFDLYKELGDIKIFSIDTPENIAKEMKKGIDKIN